MEEKITVYYSESNDAYVFIRNKMSFFAIREEGDNFILKKEINYKEEWFEDSPVCRKIEDYELVFNLIDYLFFNESKQIIYSYGVHYSSILMNKDCIINKMEYDLLKEYFTKYKKQLLSNL